MSRIIAFICTFSHHQIAVKPTQCKIITFIENVEVFSSLARIKILHKYFSGGIFKVCKRVLYKLV